MPVELTAPELATHERIGALVRGNAEPEQHARDAFHLVEAAKYGGRHFITNDKRLLKKASQIWTELLLRVLTAQEFVEEYYPEDASGQDGTAMIRKRQIVTPEELNHYLTREIRKIEDLEDARLQFQYVLRDPDEGGCNWSGAILSPGSKGSPEYGAPYARVIVQKARTLYNIKE
jgi:hypothetical protein